MLPPFAGRPELALAVVRLAFIDANKMHRAHPERGRLFEDLPRRLGARQADDQHYRVEWRWWRLAPGEAQLKRIRAGGLELALAQRSVDDAGVEGVARPATE